MVILRGSLSVGSFFASPQCRFDSLDHLDPLILLSRSSNLDFLFLLPAELVGIQTAKLFHFLFKLQKC